MVNYALLCICVYFCISLEMDETMACYKMCLSFLFSILTLMLYPIWCINAYKKCFLMRIDSEHVPCCALNTLLTHWLLWFVWRNAWRQRHTQTHTQWNCVTASAAAWVGGSLNGCKVHLRAIPSIFASERVPAPIADVVCCLSHTEPMDGTWRLHWQTHTTSTHTLYGTVPQNINVPRHNVRTNKPAKTYTHIKEDLNEHTHVARAWATMRHDTRRYEMSVRTAYTQHA